MTVEGLGRFPVGAGRSQLGDLPAARHVGTPSRAGGAEAGDDVFLWKPNSGWLVHCRLTSKPRRVQAGEVLPWPDDRTYQYVMDIEVVSEPAEPLPFRGAEAASLAALAHHVQLGQFGRMTDEGIRRIGALSLGAAARRRPRRRC